MIKANAIVAPVFCRKETQDLTDSLRHDQIGFEKLAILLEKCSGIHMPVSEKNMSLMAGRLANLLVATKSQSYDDYLRYLAEGDLLVIQDFVSALATNTTEFFRDAAHFDIFAKMAPELLQERGELRIWCSASSTGQEPWTILMTLSEVLSNFGPSKIKLLATDIDFEALEKGIIGIYSEEETRGIPTTLRQKYFRVISGSTKAWRIKADLAECVTFAPLNLNAEYFPFQRPFDVIFCRNVLTYFNEPTAQKVLGHLVDVLSPGGCLFLGSSESGTLRNDKMHAIAPAVYQRKY